ncbi:putative ankyrin repeat protein [Zancudomyces culisetae]|uniref:Putative ankyrin repeat protein n=1 Tax=Zancudomyces culisetae TaxID=1213189 RepID=A0A1R1PD19_ZANCU|nr:putative ankyrin repeat protein [Zancudomyces culisetae]|eukprot:OMH78833.1 putative ankyrin repeat protein [Zancudomyces culisetae]
MDIRMLQLLSENHAFVEILDQHDIIRLCSIENSEIAKRLLEFSNEDRDKSKTPESQVKKGKGLNFSKAMLCLIEACQNYVLSCINERAGPEDVVQIEIIDYIVENNLQNTINDTEYDEKNDVKDKNIVEVSINDYYELAKSELVNRNLGELKLLIEYGMDANANANANGSLILRTAYKAGDICWIDYFISKGMKLEGESDGFEEACKSDKVEVLEHWIKNEGVVPKNSRYECINMACLLGNFDIVKLLVDNGMDLSDPKRNGVRIACSLGLRRTLKYLLDNNAAIDGTCHYQLEYACMIEDIGLVKMILEYYDSLGVLKKRENIDMKGRGKVLTELFLNIESSNCSEECWITKTLLERGEPIQNIDLLEAVKTSIKTNNIEILKILLTYNIDLNSDYKILMFAVQVGNIEVVKLLLKNGLSVKNNSSIVDVALETNNVDMIRFLLQYGAEVLSCSLQLKYFNIDDIETLHLMLDCCPDIVGASPLLQSAIEKNNLEVVKLLLRDPATLGNYGYDFVYYACRSNNIEILKLLFEKEKNTKRGNESGVIQACENNNLEMLKLLLERNPHLVLFEEYGLKEAIDNENVEMIKLLIKYGVDMSGHTVSIMKVASGLNDNELLSICQNMGTGN